MSLSFELEQRGFIHQYTAASLADIVDGERRTVYHGFDPSADSIHAGNFAQWILLKHLAKAGHRVVLLVGGATGRIGDPKPDSERPLVDEGEINRRVEKMRIQAEQLLGNTVELVNNYDWFKEVKFIDFLRDIGKCFTVNELIKKDAIATRLASDTGLSYTEFAYPLMQGYDYLVLYREKGCTIQTGGSDQWGNMIAGVDLIRRVERAEAHVLTTPLIIDKVTGKKFGKSEGNAIWLDPEKTSPYQFYQFWLNTADENVIDYLKLFTFLSLDEIKQVTLQHQTNPGARHAQKVLAKEVSELVHGQVETELVTTASQVLFGENPQDMFTDEIKQILLKNAPTTMLGGEISIIDLLLEAGLASSKREARTFIESGSISLDSVTVNELETVIHPKQLTQGIGILKRGKKHLTVLVAQ